MKQCRLTFRLLPAMLMAQFVVAIKFTMDANTSLGIEFKKDGGLALLEEAQESDAGFPSSRGFRSFGGGWMKSPAVSIGDATNAVFSTADQELDAAASGNVKPDTAAVTSVSNGIKRALGVAVDTLKHKGMPVGSAPFNSAVVVGSHIVQGAVLKKLSLPSNIQVFASRIGNDALPATNLHNDEGQVQEVGVVAMKGEELSRALQGVQEGAKLAQAVGGEIDQKAKKIHDSASLLEWPGSAWINSMANTYQAVTSPRRRRGPPPSLGDIGKVGPLSVGFEVARTVWDETKKFVECLAEGLTLCHILIGSTCDCSDNRSYVKPSTSGFDMKCTFTTSSEFGGGFGLRAEASKSFDGSAAKTSVLPGEEYAQAYKTVNQVMMSRQALKPQKAKAPSASCETNLEVAFEGAAQFSPTISVSMTFDGSTRISIEGMVRASIHALVEGEGSCSFRAQRGLPKKPKTKVVCSGKFCIVFMLQFVADLEIQGTLTGTVEASADVDFEFDGSVTVNKNGEAVSEFGRPSIKHQTGFAIGASAAASVRIGMGPVFTIWPVPGIPINFNPTINAEAKALGTLEFKSGTALLQEGHSRSGDNHSVTRLDDTSNVQMCSAAALTGFADLDITGFSLPSSFRAELTTEKIQELIEDGILAGAQALIQLITGPLKCVPGGDKVADGINSAAETASSTLQAMIPSLNLNFEVPSIQLLDPQKLWCKEVYKTPGFDDAACSDTLGCKSAGRPPSGDAVHLPSEQKLQDSKAGPSFPSLSSLKMGDRFIQIGKFRLGASDDNHFSVEHESRWTAQIYRSDGTTHPGPRRDFGTWTRPVEASRGISFGFQYIQIGKFRLGAIDDSHLSLSHENGITIMIFRHDRHLFGGPRHDFGAFDRAEGAPFGVTFGDEFIQIGKFRLGVIHDHLALTHISNQLLQLYKHDGTLHPHAGNAWSVEVNARQPAPWYGAKDIAEVAYGACIDNFVSFGERFIQLGQWRLAAMDENHFSVCHKDGIVSMLYLSDGTRHWGPRRDWCSWKRPTGFPHGITFGPGFIQIGNFRLGAIDDNHLSLAHENGNTIQIFRSDDTRWPGPRHDWTAWKQSAGPAAGVAFGDRFLQLGKFRIGDHDGNHFVIAHKDGASIQLFRSDGTEHPYVGNAWSHAVFSRYPRYDCGGIQDMMGTCPGLAAGDNFLMIGDWRLAALDGAHFSVSHRGGQTPILYRSDGVLFPGPQTNFNTWDWESRNSHYKILFGDRFIQFGRWRLGEFDKDHLVMWNANGHIPQIWKSDGTLHFHHHNTLRLGDRPNGPPQGITFGDRFVQIGSWRIGDVDSEHFSIAHVNGVTVEIFRHDGRLGSRNRFPGPRDDFTTFGRPILDCDVV